MQLYIYGSLTLTIWLLQYKLNFKTFRYRGEIVNDYLQIVNDYLHKWGLYLMFNKYFKWFMYCFLSVNKFKSFF